ncbi:hypothetical protein mRhiFer1_009440 [Rhinolophus ferrumequinum]|uniref:Uncharacterized protein n=1 Tax=Rhinolophus ferrumequinum TaxID=59479 RepID=A0A7J7RIX5_RHIFE|nr:hypothetical protein mRhiFer1_009440 [Rhinolophus ferrumequinum]
MFLGSQSSRAWSITELILKRTSHGFGPIPVYPHDMVPSGCKGPGQHNQIRTWINGGAAVTGLHKRGRFIRLAQPSRRWPPVDRGRGRKVQETATFPVRSCQGPSARQGANGGRRHRPVLSRLCGPHQGPPPAAHPLAHPLRWHQPPRGKRTQAVCSDPGSGLGACATWWRFLTCGESGERILLGKS